MSFTLGQLGAVTLTLTSLAGPLSNCVGVVPPPSHKSDRDGPIRLGGGSTHAWCQIDSPGSGWIEFDPTNGIVGNRDLIRVAVPDTETGYSAERQLLWQCG